MKDVGVSFVGKAMKFNNKEDGLCMQNLASLSFPQHFF
jgi:hypothetical protein